MDFLLDTYLVLFFITLAFGSSWLALILHRQPKIQKTVVFTLTALSGIFAIFAGLKALLSAQALSYSIKTTLPNLNVQLMLDPLSGFFLVILGLIVFCVSLYGPGYMSHNEPKKSSTSVYFFSGLFITSMYLVLLAYEVFTFMLAWELMSISSYFLVIHNHEKPANRRAALIYLIMAQASGLFILFAYSLLIKFTGSLNFAVWHGISFPPYLAHLAFFLAFIGFGMKAGIVPLHIWLPKAHPAAPAHISALMSGVMLKIAVYGLIRFTLDLLHTLHWQWGAAMLFVGITSALLGVLYALMQHDLKKLLAYHSVENIGIIFSAFGLALIFASFNYPLLAALSLIGALYHCLNHAIFKSLLFLGAGAIINSTHEHDLEHLGGLIKKMPHTAWYFLIGCISISALPPFNGFVSEWLFFQASLQATVLKSDIMRTLIPVAAAVIALTGALAAACFVKVYGVAFLGQARSSGFEQAQDPKFGMQVAMGILAFLCLFFGILPNFTIVALNNISQQLLQISLPSTADWLWLIPINPTKSSYSAAIIVGAIVAISLITYILTKITFGRTYVQKVKPWDCGFGGINARMQYNGTAFSMPFRRIFQNLFLPEEKIEKINGKFTYSLKIKDLFLQYIYLPLGRFSTFLAKNFARLQGGNVRVYLTYIFITLITLLWTTTQFG